MILLNVAGIRRQYGPEPVLESVTFEVRPGDRIGLVGPNGSGKTTLLRILAGKDEADAGSYEMHPAARLGYLEQQPHFEADRTLRDEALSALADLMALQQEAIEVAADMATVSDPIEQKRLAARYDHLQHELQQQDAYNIEHRLERVLDGLRLRRESFDQPVASLSGGEQNRLMLAKLLLAEPNLMILDEPSNHLDIDATEWLEDFLVEGSAAMLVVSHDRYFLDKVTNRTLELFHGTVDGYTGNFSAYWQQKADRLLVQGRTYAKQQIEIEKTKDFIRRNTYGQKHAQAEDRRKKLERIELVTPPREIAAPTVRFPPAKRSGDFVLRAEGLAKAYDRPLFRDVSIEIRRAERWALLGPNGCGKTTLLRCLLGLLPADQGQIKLGTGVTVGYFDQQLAELDDELEVADAIRPKHKQMNQLERRNLLAAFGLTGDRALQPVKSLSGGERCRAALARLAAADANFLVLDEPTNHLDLWARDALEKALLHFHGTVLFVSHDRYFVNRVADHVLAVEPDGVLSIEGNYDSYQARSDGAPAEAPGDDAPSKPSPQRSAKSTKPAKGAKGDKPKAAKQGKDDKGANSDKSDQEAKEPPRSIKKRRFPFRKVADLEDEIFEQETSIAALQNELLQPEVLRDGERVRQIKLQLEQEQALLKGIYEHWEEASELNW
jgi:ATP-binding cassette subfamily F protein 3